MKLKISKSDFEALDEHFKNLYKLNSETELYELQIEGLEDTGALKRAKDREAQERKEAVKRVKELEAKLAEIGDNDARKSGDIATLEKSWESKLDKMRADFEKKQLDLQKVASDRENQMKSLVKDRTALEIASNLFSDAELFLPHVASRIDVELTDEGPKARFLDQSGKISALTKEDFVSEFRANAKFANYIKGTDSSGSGTSQQKTPVAPTDSKPVDLSKLSAKQLVERRNANKGADNGTF